MYMYCNQDIVLSQKELLIPCSLQLSNSSRIHVISVTIILYFSCMYYSLNYCRRIAT